MDTHSPPVPDYCPNCHYPQGPQDAYCSHCGQKRQEAGRLSLSEFLGDIFYNMFNLENGKVWYTPLLLLRPGFLTNDYLQGRRQRYMRPYKVFLLSVFVFFLGISFISDFEVDDGKGGGYRDLFKKQGQHELAMRLDSLNRLMRDSLPGLDGRSADTLLHWARVDSMSAKQDSSEFELHLLGDSLPTKFANEDMLELSEDELLEKYSIEGFANRMLVRQFLRIMESPNGVVAYIVGLASKLILFLVPIYALLLKLLYWRQRRYYLEHLVFAFHIHAAIMLWLLVLAILDDNVPDWLTLVWFFCYFVYETMALKAVYRQSWRKTLLKYVFLLGPVYGGIVLFGMIITALVGLALF